MSVAATAFQRPRGSVPETDFEEAFRPVGNKPKQRWASSRWPFRAEAVTACSVIRMSDFNDALHNNCANVCLYVVLNVRLQALDAYPKVS